MGNADISTKWQIMKYIIHFCLDPLPFNTFFRNCTYLACMQPIYNSNIAVFLGKFQDRKTTSGRMVTKVLQIFGIITTKNTAD